MSIDITLKPSCHKDNYAPPLTSNARAFKAQFADKVRELDVKILAGGREI